MAERNHQQIYARYLRSLPLDDGSMDDIPDAQIRSDEEEDQPDFDVDPEIKL